MPPDSETNREGSHEGSGDPFTQTHWSVVRQAQAGSHEALEELVAAYRAPIVRHLQRHLGPNDGEDASQDYLVGLLTSGYLTKASQEHGKFRAFLLHDLRYFILGWRRKRGAIKRGGKTPKVSYEAALEAGVPFADPHDDDAVEAFDQDWAGTLLVQARNALREKQEKGGNMERFEAMEPFLELGGSPEDYETAARKLGMTTNAFTTALTRLRQSYAALLKERVSHSLLPGESVEEEMAYLRQCYQKSLERLGD